jgi:hypothetical protein
MTRSTVESWHGASGQELAQLVPGLIVRNCLNGGVPLMTKAMGRRWWMFVLALAGATLGAAPQAPAQESLGPFLYHWRDVVSDFIPTPTALGTDEIGSGFYFASNDDFTYFAGSRACFVLQKSRRTITTNPAPSCCRT